MNNSKDRILDAAEQIVLRDGVAHLTQDAVAAETGMSKGGVLYHFHSKDDLIRGMIRRLHEQYTAEMKRIADADPNPVGRKVRAMLATTFRLGSGEHSTRIDHVAAALLAAVATNSSLLDETREVWAEWEKEILNDNLDPILALVINCASDGIWMSGLFGIHQPSGELRQRVIERLRQMSFGASRPAGS